MSAPPGRSSSTHAALSFGVFFAALFSGLGVYLPYWPLWLKHHGMSAREIGVLVSLPLIARSIASPALARVIDRTGHRRRAIGLLALGAFVVFLFYGGARSFTPLLLIGIGFGFCFSSLSPLADNLATLTAREHDLDYGRVRLWGSVAFLAMAMAAGEALNGRSPDILFPLGATCIAACALTAWLLPPIAADDAGTGDGRGGVGLPRRRDFALLCLVSALVQGSHGTYYGFSTLHWQANDLSERVIGILWAEAVVAEIVLFAFATALLRRVGATGLLLIGAAAALVRWPLTAACTGVASLAAIQLLHALSFGATHFACVAWISRRIPVHRSATAQSIFGAATGLGVAAGTAIAGELYARDPAASFRFMAGPVAIGIAIALWRRRAWSD